MTVKVVKTRSPAENARLAIQLLEELGWLLASKRNLDLKRAAETLRLMTLDGQSGAFSKRYTKLPPNKTFLVGVLPRLFQDEVLFPSNEDIADFSLSVLDVPISRSAKRSRYELIGFVVCLANDLDDSKLASLVEALESIAGNSEKLRTMAQMRTEQKLTWNDAIRKLSGND